MANEKNAKEHESKLSNEKKAQEVIDSICAKKEESYDQFMKSFTMLQKEDVMQQLMKDVSEELMSEPIKKEDGTTKRNLLARKDKKTLEGDDDVETEILLEGTCCGSMLGNERPTGKKIVQFDNFVDEVESDEDDDGMGGLEGGKYVASFCHRSNETEDVGRINVEECADTPLVCTDIKSLPGEAEDGEGDNSGSLHPAVNTIQLDLSSRLQQSSDQINTKPHEVTCDDVIPFSLDEEFDYNNVILTPKWTGDTQPPGSANGT